MGRCERVTSAGRCARPATQTVEDDDGDYCDEHAAEVRAED